MTENYSEGDLGVIFNRAEPISLSSAYQYLKEVDAVGTNEKAKDLIQNCRKEVEWMQDGCCSETTAKELSQLKLSLNTESSALNANLANIITDEEGNIIANEEQAETTEEGSKEGLKRFEVVQLCTLIPKSVGEAIVLIPSLARFSEHDLKTAVEMVKKYL
ncbi:hypothetical protein AGDE_00797 [Angomonas deanei]|uniref:RNA polymerase Rpb4, putative n=1 Tax=Angomonas deanei TaxID=59799 RepID=A0A7G2C154_9TRYP|nr:hypothetical protein AGDE_00797 [Angomonas deanei]CAD2213409.1 RNA polymerase Rpb4, putative [Angomonas deanei]|eukprot:EPY43126.1 hypothetical protein AGDE_00797 [Angomonas deanei]